MKLLYDGKEMGRVITNKSLHVDEVLELLEIDVYEEEGGEEKYNWDLFTLEPA